MRCLALTLLLSSLPISAYACGAGLWSQELIGELRYASPTVTEAYLISPNQHGKGVPASAYPRAHALLLASGCVQLGAYFGPAQMNCALQHYGLSPIAELHQPRLPAIDLLNNYWPEDHEHRPL